MKYISILFFLISTSSFGQTKLTLPKPSGEYFIGTNIFEWTNKSVKDTSTTLSNTYRVIGVQIWYPAQNVNELQKSHYSPLYREGDSTITNSFLNAEFAEKIEKVPVIIICPGRGMRKHDYTIISEDLASNGFVVVSIDMPHLGFVKYNNGLVVKPSKQFRLPPDMLAGPYEKVDSFYKNAANIGNSDVQFVIKQLKNLNKSSLYAFQNRLDLDNIGIFGHSLGGRIAGQAIANNKQIKAYISMEGISPREVRMNGIGRTMVYMMSEDLVKYAMPNYEQAIPKRKGKVAIITLKDYGHNSFTDLPFTDPISTNYKISKDNCLIVNRLLLLAFFNTELKQIGNYEMLWANNNFINSKIYKMQ